MTPVVGVDVWEHAYYLKYQNKRPDYLKAVWNVINWDVAAKDYAGTKSSPRLLRRTNRQRRGPPVAALLHPVIDASGLGRVPYSHAHKPDVTKEIPARDRHESRTARPGRHDRPRARARHADRRARPGVRTRRGLPRDRPFLHRRQRHRLLRGRSIAMARDAAHRPGGQRRRLFRTAGLHHRREHPHTRHPGE